jgi:hypothetical protein
MYEMPVTLTKPIDDSVASPADMRLVYFVHDLGDPAVARRLLMLQPHLSTAVIIGFHRAAHAPAQLSGWPVIALGRTADGKLARRAVSVLRNLALLRRLRHHLRGANFVMARQLEMLVLASAARRRYAKTAILAYECLDIHNAMVKPSLIREALRHLEAQHLREADVVVVSSPAFIKSYLKPIHGPHLPSLCLVENKVLRAELQDWPGPQPPLPGPPWRIGWFGVLRCRRSLELLIELTRKLPGQIIVELRGRPSRTAIPDFDELVALAPGMVFLGAYDRQSDLAQIYQAVHFTWAIDDYEAGLNSAWLLPNRLYEGGVHGAVPLASTDVETGNWLAAEHAGILLAEPLGAALLNYFSTLTAIHYLAARAELDAVPVERWVDNGQDAARLSTSAKRA